MFQNIVVAYEEHPEAERALQSALKLASPLGATLRVLTIAEPLPAYSAFTAVAGSSALQTLAQDRDEFQENPTSRIRGERFSDVVLCLDRNVSHLRIKRRGSVTGRCSSPGGSVNLSDG